MASGMPSCLGLNAPRVVFFGWKKALRENHKIKRVADGGTLGSVRGS
jgi:hypothetical protein